ncbi:ATP-binding protein [Oceanobacillus sp. CAU 1775]
MSIESFYSTNNLKEKRQVFDSYADLPRNFIQWIEENQAAGTIVWNEIGEVCFISKSMIRLLGYSRNDWLGLNWKNIIEGEIVKEITSNFINRSVKEKEFIIPVRTSENKEIQFEVLLEKLFDDHSKENYYIASLKDLSYVKSMQELMLQIEKMSVVGQLGASIAHEIRNPLTSIKGFLQLLQAGVQYKEEYYRIMAIEIEKMETITTELLVASKPTSEDWQEEDVLRMVRDVVLLLQSQARLKDIHIKIDLPIDEKIYCNASQIKQVLINLIKNAIEAMENPGEITVAARSLDENVHISVRDEGIGIPDDSSKRLGEAFYTTKKEGTGLGLNITKDILSEHNGSLRFYRNPGKGSTFEITLPKYTKNKSDGR